MSNLPPQPGGWIDGSGNLQQGSPPPGFWQASDGRWYPPDLASSSTQAVGPGSPYGPPSGPPPGGGYQSGPPGYNPQGVGGYPGQHHSGPGYTPPPSVSGGNSKTGLYVALGVVAAVLILGLSTVLIINAGDEQATDDTTTTTGSTGQTPDTAGGGTVTTAGGGGTGAPVAGGGGGSEGGDVTATCTLIDAETVQVDMTNTTSEITDFTLTMVFRDDTDTRVGDDTVYISYLRPGERTVETSYLFDGAGTLCEVVEIDEYGLDSEGVDAAANATCEVIGEDVLGFVDADVSITNTLAQRTDFTVAAAFVGADGVRRGYATVYVEAVEPGEAAPGDAFSSVSFEEGLTCEVVYVTTL